MSRDPATDRNTTGAAWERAARRHLEAAGLRLLSANERYSVGEIDLVMEDRGSIVFVEVRYRGSDAFGGSALSVDAHKQRKLVRAAECFLAANQALARKPCRFDVIAIDGSAEPPRVQWIRNAFDAF